MSLPPKRKPVKSGIERAPKRTWPKHRRFVKSHCCCVPGCEATNVDFAHLRSAANAGTGLKPHDCYGVSLCRAHHDEQHRIGADSFGQKYNINLWALALEFTHKSPDKWMKFLLPTALSEEGRDASPETPR